MISQQVGWLNGKGVCPHSKGQKDQTTWVVLCVVNNGMLIEYSIIEFLS